jgi:general secretion pathway protein I
VGKTGQTPALVRLSRHFRPKVRASAGFSLLEVLVAFTLFAVAMGVLMQIFSRGVNGAALASQYAKATMYAESKLAAVGVEEGLKEGVTGGKIDDDYAWQISVTPYLDPTPRDQMSIDFEKQFHSQLYQIESRITFTADDRRERVVVLSTLQFGLRQ